MVPRNSIAFLVDTVVIAAVVFSFVGFCFRFGNPTERGAKGDDEMGDLVS